MIKTEWLYYLTQVAKYNSINKAAENLYMTSSAISAAMKQLELECGFSILERTYRGVKLTENGKKVVKIAERILFLQDEILNLNNVETIERKKYGLITDRQTIKLLSNKIVGPGSRVLENFQLKELSSISMDYYEKLENDSVMLMILTDENRETVENDTRIYIRYLYASKQYPVSSKNTKWIKENVKKLSRKEFEKLPKIKIKAADDIIDDNIVLETNDSDIYAEAILNDYGVGLVTKFAPDIHCIDYEHFKVYEPFDDEIYVVMVARKDCDIKVLLLLERLIKG